MAAADCIGVLRGLQKLSRAALSVHQQKACEHWRSSYLLHTLVSWRPIFPPSAGGSDPVVQQEAVHASTSTETVSDGTSSIPSDRTHAGATENFEKVQAFVSSEATEINDGTAKFSADQETAHEVRHHEQAAPALSSRARQRRVPASRVSRLMSFGGLAAGLGVGAVAEFSKRTMGMSQGSAQSSPFLTEANINRLVATLCRVRGAALKLGQMISIQDGQFISPEIQQIFERVRDGADYMPPKQALRAIASELGADWRDHLDSFDELPMAAASIGQVHRAVLKDGRHVVMKVQYPGVAESIDSDINNILTLMNSTKILPEGLFAENALRVAKKELSWEVDYKREAECAKRFAGYLEGHPYFVVPRIIDELSSERVLTMEMLDGWALDQHENLTQTQRNEIGHHMLDLCLREVFEFRFMQTDPNWSNFFFLPKENKIGLLDFGASRDFPKTFTDEYLRVIHGAARGDRKAVLDGSLRMGFLTGFETDVMMKAHTDAVMVLGEPFASATPFDFGAQHVTGRIRQLMPVMLEHRLTPPPEETYSLHRKLSGAFLLCAKLQSRIICKPILENIVGSYRYD